MDENEVRKRVPATYDTESDLKNDIQENGDCSNIELDRLKKMANQLRESFMEQMDKSLNQIMDDIVHEVESCKPRYLNSSILNNSNSSKGIRPKGENLPEKKFVTRHSYLTDMFESEHIQTIYHIFIAILLLLFLNTVIYDYVDTGKINLDFELIQWTFAQFHYAMAIWGGMFLTTVLVIYPGFNYWATNRSTKNEFWDRGWIILYVLYICMFFYFPVLKMVEHKLPPASSAIVLMEQVRLLMKSHAFVRSNIPRALAYGANKKDKNDQPTELTSDFSKFLYFLFVPTLVYRDRYPRCSQIRWNYVISNFGQVVGCLFYTYFVFVRFCVPLFHKFGQEPMSPKNLILSVFGNMLPSVLVLLCGFYAILHAWQNAFAEMLKFSDRMFYKDWWNSTTFATYYRTWNVVVHDWLFTYVYSDVYLLVKHTAYGKLIPTLTVFAVSALVHDFIAGFMFRFFYPVLLVLFGVFGSFLVFVTGKSKGPGYWNIFVWLCLFLGSGILTSLYSMEYYARKNCPAVSDSFIDYFIPRSWMCNAIRGEPS